MQQESSDPGIRPSTGVGSALPARDQRRGPSNGHVLGRREGVAR